MHFYRLFIAFVLSLLALAVVPLCYSSTLIDRHHFDGHKVRIETVIPAGWPDFLNIEQLTDVHFWKTHFQRAATACPVSENLQWQLSCLKLSLERTALNTHHAGGLKAGNGDGAPPGSQTDKGTSDKNNHYQKEQRFEPDGQESRSPGEGYEGRGGGDNRKNDNGEESEKNTTTQDLLALANQLIAIIESGDPDAVFKLGQILDELEMPQRLQVLETEGTNNRGDPVTPLEAALDLQRSFYENSTRNRFIKQLIEATSDKTRTLNAPNILSSLRPIIPPDWTLSEVGDNHLRILYKIVQDIIHRVNQSDQQPPIGQFEKYCFIEYFVQLFLFYSNPLELIRHLLGQISDSAVTHEILIAAQSLTSASSFSNTFMQFHQHPSFHELQHFLNERLIQLHTDPSPREPAISSTGQVHSFHSASGSGYSQQGARPKRLAHNDQPNVLRQKGLKTRQSCGNHQTRLGSTPSFTRAGRAIAVPARKTMDDYMNINAFRDNAFKVDKVKHAQITDNECPICRKHFSRTARLVKTPCNHIFHVLCLNLWLQRELPHLSVLTCPVCRSELNNLKEKLNNLNKLLRKYGNCHSLDSANRAVKEWNTTETGYETLYHFVQLCRHNSKVSDDSGYVNILRKIIHPITKANIPHDLRINSATFSPNSRRVVTASNDCTAKIYGHKDDGSWEEEVTIRHNGTVKSASFSSDNCRLITASTDHKAKIFSQEDDGSWTKKLTVQHTGKVNSATFSTDSYHIVTASEDGTAKIFAQKDDRPWEKEATISHNGPIQSATFSLDCRHVVTVGKDNVVKITGRSANGTWKIKATISHDDAINSATFSPDARRMVTASEDCTAIIYAQQDDGSWEKEFTISHIDSDGPIQSASFSPDDRHVMTVGRDDLVKIYGKQDNGPWLKKAIIAHEDRINSATFSADGCHLVTASDDNTAKIYGEKTDASWEEEITVYHYHKVLSATFSPNSRHMVTISIDRAAKIHSHNDNGSWKEDTTTLYRDWVCFCSATFSTDGRFVVTFTMDKKAKIHTLKDDASWKKEITICHDGTVLSASFSADSRFLVTTNFMSDGGRFYHTAKITELWKEE